MQELGVSRTTSLGSNSERKLSANLKYTDISTSERDFEKKTWPVYCFCRGVSTIFYFRFVRRVEGSFRKENKVLLPQENQRKSDKMEVFFCGASNWPPLWETQAPVGENFNTRKAHFLIGNFMAYNLGNFCFCRGCKRTMQGQFPQNGAKNGQFRTPPSYCVGNTTER